MKTYSQIKKEHHDKMNAFTGIFFAFSNEQFAKGLKKLGLKENELNKLVKIGGGGFILKSRVQAFKDMFAENERELKEFRKNKKNLIDSIVYELQNHEYCYTNDVEPALEALGLKESELDPAILKAAKKKCWELDEMKV